MATRKAALMGSREGPWVSVAGMKDFRVRIFPDHRQVAIHRQGDFIRIEVLGDEPCAGVLCHIITE